MDRLDVVCSSPEQLVNQHSAAVTRTQLVSILRHPCDLQKLVLLIAVSLHDVLGFDKAQMEGEEEGGGISLPW